MVRHGKLRGRSQVLDFLLISVDRRIYFDALPVNSELLPGFELLERNTLRTANTTTRQKVAQQIEAISRVILGEEIRVLICDVECRLQEVLRRTIGTILVLAAPPALRHSYRMHSGNIPDPRHAARSLDPVVSTVAQFRQLWDGLNSARGHG
ncbi:hypothetical protein [Burkholderia pseudomultivorans]|uniref:hypothetical protein n=1 Tax=Burkholderia pseudomultivorans TaxID=1207504 RepID=UPI0018C5A240|nr:hypothetical protein [Burkholderia pseudomultivorans]